MRDKKLWLAIIFLCVIVVVLLLLFICASYAVVVPRFPITSIEDRNNMIHFLKDVTDTLDVNNIQYSLACGTLLGAYRTSNIILSDDDLDIMVLESDIDKIATLYTNTKTADFGLQLDSSDKTTHLDFFAISWDEERELYMYRDGPTKLMQIWREKEYVSKAQWEKKDKLFLKTAEFSTITDVATYLDRAYPKWDEFASVHVRHDSSITSTLMKQLGRIFYAPYITGANKE